MPVSPDDFSNKIMEIDVSGMAAGIYVVKIVVDDDVQRKRLYERFKYAQQFSQVDPWAARAEGVESHEYQTIRVAG